MSAQATQSDTELLTVRDLARRDTGLGIPSGEKADLIINAAQDNMDMTVVEFSRKVIGQQVYESYVREVLEEANPSSFGVDIDDCVFV